MTPNQNNFLIQAALIFINVFPPVNYIFNYFFLSSVKLADVLRF